MLQLLGTRFFVPFHSVPFEDFQHLMFLFGMYLLNWFVYTYRLVIRIVIVLIGFDLDTLLTTIGWNFPCISISTPKQGLTHHINRQKVFTIQIFRGVAKSLFSIAFRELVCNSAWEYAILGVLDIDWLGWKHSHWSSASNVIASHANYAHCSVGEAQPRPSTSFNFQAFFSPTIASNLTKYCSSQLLTWL